MLNRHLSVPSFAKINLSLRVLGKRPDGYHEVQTVLHTVSLHDSLHFAATCDPEINFSCEDAAIPQDRANLVVKAAEALREHYNVKVGARVQLEKRIPVQAGLGGGSSNAAITLLALSRLWELPATHEELVQIGSELGADVPFFLTGGCALATGIGTTLTELPSLPQQRILIVAPLAKVATANAYKALEAPALTTLTAASILASSRTQSIFSDSEQWALCDHLENDFERVIFDMEPEIRRVKEALMQAGARCALLAGSGSSVFGIFDNDDVLGVAAHSLYNESVWQNFSCVTLSRDEYLHAIGSAIPGRRTKDSDTGA
ncbi:MAG TPA: 4-(cytidine 5'-diphospho)-2-C-methyl-D-erythritol kinase [Pyrinomonadaceae bacterium]|nr:4-(cytidine 5'-diphospho)-2-C-methyl-D-erythritol kinase [Pyrinomonadaceae bacterium]